MYRHVDGREDLLEAVVTQLLTGVRHDLDDDLAKTCWQGYLQALAASVRRIAVYHTVHQAYLSATSDHRWRSPVAGTVVRAFVVDGTYYPRLTRRVRMPSSRRTRRATGPTSRPAR